eukprot:3591538-Rhodomonas_salina.1
MDLLQLHYCDHKNTTSQGHAQLCSVTRELDDFALGVALAAVEPQAECSGRAWAVRQGGPVWGLGRAAQALAGGQAG